MAFVPFCELIPGAFTQTSVKLKASEAFTRGDTFKIDAGTGYAEAGAAANATLKGVAMETVTAVATDGITEMLVVYFNDNQEWLADCATAWAQTEMGSAVSLEDKATIDNDDTGNTPLFDMKKGYGAAAKKKVVVRPNMSKLTGGSA